MFKKLAVVTSAFALAVASVPMFAAFEAHVINVTARIENALFVHPESISFGTVFPQEYLERGTFVTFSESFSETDQTRVSTVHYVIKQKPKPRDGFLQEVGVTVARDYCHLNLPTTPYDSSDTVWTTYLEKCYPSLCPYLSKTPDNHPVANDYGVPAFHDPELATSVARGKIKKTGTDVGDTWIIDLPVPCFKGACAQDWADFVRSHNPAADPNDYMLPPELEHEVFGCDLWFEVTAIDNLTQNGVDPLPSPTPEPTPEPVP